MGKFVVLLVAALLGLGVGPAPAQAQARPPTLDQQADEAARAMREAIERAMRMLEGVIGTIPQYQAPEVLPNGDIIIRRIPPAAPGRPPQRAPTPAPKPAPNAPTLEET